MPCAALQMFAIGPAKWKAHELINRSLTGSLCLADSSSTAVRIVPEEGKILVFVVSLFLGVSSTD